MSLEKDIGEVKKIVEQEIFQPAQPEELKGREKEYEKMWWERVEEIDILRDIHEDNQGKRYTDEQWIAILKTLFANNKNITFRNLEDLQEEIRGFLMAADDATITTLKVPLRK